MQPGDFVLCKGWPDLFSAVVEEATHSDYVHVLSVIDESSYLHPAWPRLRRLTGLLPAGPDQHLVSPPLTDAERAAVQQELMQMVGRPYGLRAMLWVGACDIVPPLRRFRSPLHVHTTVCSTTLTMAYYRAGCYPKLGLGALEPHEVSAGDLARAVGLTEGPALRELLREREEEHRDPEAHHHTLPGAEPPTQR